MDNHTMDTMSMRGHTQDRNENRGFGGRYKSKCRSKSYGKGIMKCWKCDKVGHYKNDCRSKNVEKEKGSKDTPSTEVKTSSKGRDVYLNSMDNNSKHDIWMIESDESCHMTPHRQWLCEYEKYNGGYVYLGYDSLTNII